LVNGLQPTVANVKTRLSKETYPKTYNAASIGQAINDQLVAPGGSGYQIVGFTFIDTYSCYSTSIAGGAIGGPAQGKALLGVLKTFYATASSNVTNILSGQGFLQAPSQVNTLLSGTGGPLNATGGIQNSACPKT
jgi:hypothetical protein